MGGQHVESTGMSSPYQWAFGPKFSKQGSIYSRFSLQIGLDWLKLTKMINNR